MTLKFYISQSKAVKEHKSIVLHTYLHLTGSLGKRLRRPRWSSQIDRCKPWPAWPPKPGGGGGEKEEGAKSCCAALRDRSRRRPSEEEEEEESVGGVGGITTTTTAAPPFEQDHHHHHRSLGRRCCVSSVGHHVNLDWRFHSNPPMGVVLEWHSINFGLSPTLTSS